MGKHRIPQEIEPFDAFIGPANAHLQSINPDTSNPRWQDYPGFTLDMATDWNTFAGQWSVLHPKYQNKDTRTKTISKDTHKLIVDFTEFAMPTLNLIAANPNGTSQDEVIFHLVLDKNHKDPTQSHTPIAEACYAKVKSIGGGELSVGCRTEEDASRNSLAHGADSVEVAYSIGEPFVFDEHGETYRTHLFGKAEFTLRVNPIHEGKKIYMRFRWYNLKHETLAGAWSEVMYSVIIT